MRTQNSLHFFEIMKQSYIKLLLQYFKIIMALMIQGNEVSLIIV